MGQQAVLATASFLAKGNIIIIQLQMSRVRKIYNLRKTTNIKTQQQAQEQSRVSQFKEEPDQIMKASDVIDKNMSVASQNQREFPSKVFDEPMEYQVDGEELSVNKLQLNFDVPINDIDKKDVRIKNIGNSAIYVQFNFKNHQKINQNGFKDTQCKFHCHHNTTVIRPGQQVTFFFSFISQFPGSFTQQIEINCQPPLRTPIPCLKLNGNAFIKDQWQKGRKNFSCDLEQNVLKNEVRQILADVVNKVKLPPPPLPDVKDAQVAEEQFESKNAHLRIFYNPELHGWFDQLFNEICEKAGKAEEDRYWDQSVETLKCMIEKADFLDQVQKVCFRNRIEHYCYLSMKPQASKNELYQTVYDFIQTAAFNMGGDYVDAARKELDMWEVPFREPLQTDTEDDLKARKEEVDKIKAEWVKKAKKKKWGEEDEKEMVNEFKKKVQEKTKQDIINRFDNFEEGAEFIRTKQIIRKSTFKLDEYHRYLERVKTVREYPLDAKKVLIKWHLKLKDNSEEKLKQLEEYLAKKKEQEKRLQEEKKEGAKKKKAAKPKKKGQKEEEEEKPLFFDFMSLLDEQNWNGFTETFKVVLEKQPFLLMIGVTYGPRAGRHLPEYSVQFLLEHLKTIENSIEFFPHSDLPTLKDKIESQAIGQGSILLLQNLNFLPSEVAQQQIIEPPTQENQPQTITKRKLLQPQIRQFFDQMGESIDVLINEDRFLDGLSGFSAYLNKDIVMGTQWWRYVGLSIRVIDSTIIFGDDFSPSTQLLLSRLAQVAKEIVLTGKAGVKFYLVKNNVDKIGNIGLGSSEKQAINGFLSWLQESKCSCRLTIPCDFVLRKVNEEQTQTMQYDGSQQDTEGWEVIDIGQKTIKQIESINQGNLFVLGQTSIERSCQRLSCSLSKMMKCFFKKQESKKERHAQQSSTPLGIDYNEDLVVYLVGIDDNLIEKVDLKDKKVDNNSDEEQQAAEEQQESDRKKGQLVSDFRLNSLGCVYRLWNGGFEMGLRDISRYALIRDD